MKWYNWLGCPTVKPRPKQISADQRRIINATENADCGGFISGMKFLFTSVFLFFMLALFILLMAKLIIILWYVGV